MNTAAHQVALFLAGGTGRACPLSCSICDIVNDRSVAPELQGGPINILSQIHHRVVGQPRYDEHGRLMGHNNKIRVNAYTGFEPVCFEKDGEVQGMDADILRAFAEKNGCELVFQKTKVWDKLWLCDNADIAIGGIGITMEREQNALDHGIEWTMPYFYVSRSVIFHANSVTRRWFEDNQEETVDPKTMKWKKPPNNVINVVLATQGSTGWVDAIENMNSNETIVFPGFEKENDDFLALNEGIIGPGRKGQNIPLRDPDFDDWNRKFSEKQKKFIEENKDDKLLDIKSIHVVGLMRGDLVSDALIQRDFPTLDFKKEAFMIKKWKMDEGTTLPKDGEVFAFPVRSNSNLSGVLSTFLSYFITCGGVERLREKYRI